MSAPKDGGQAFPRFNDNGMTLRDYFAGQALAGQLAACALGYEYTGEDAKDKCAAEAYGHADAMLAAREKGGAA